MALKVGQSAATVTYFPTYVAIQQGFFKAQGLTLDPPNPILLGNDAKVEAALESNNIDLATGTITAAFTVARVDGTIKLVGAMTNGYTIDIIVSQRFVQQTHLTEASPLEEKVKALVDKKIGDAGNSGTTEALIVYLFKMYGFDAQRDATLVNVGGTTAAGLAALANGSVDVLSFPAPAGPEAEVRGIGSIFISPVRGDIPAMVDQSYGVLFLKQSVIDAKPKAVQAFIRALAQAQEWIRRNPKRAKELLGKYLKLDQKNMDAVASLAMPSMAATPQISRQAFNTANEFHVKAGLLAVGPHYEDLVDSTLIHRALSGQASSS
ncbi:ABC transporter substrate-binding protein [Ktedonosporobacter rubrisoli]|nr:ABC transporter substrate-binding protein [Ktedonosporobacter rubrisoli]